MDKGCLFCEKCEKCIYKIAKQYEKKARTSAQCEAHASGWQIKR